MKSSTRQKHHKPKSRSDGVIKIKNEDITKIEHKEQRTLKNSNHHIKTI